MSKHKDLVSFVVLNWNGIDETLRCLDSLRAQTYTNCEIVVVDNGSAEAEKATLRKISDITFIDLPVNTGFSGGQIAAAEVTKGTYLALINNDSVIAPDWCEEALAAIHSQPKIAAVGGRAYSWNEELKQKPFDTTNAFYSYQVVNRKSGHTKTLRTGEAMASVNSISGSAVLISRAVIDKLGYFDNHYFAYYEETDLFARMKRAGYHVIYAPQLQTWHKIGQASKSNPGFYLYFMHRNRFMFAVKNFDGRYVWSFLGIYTKEWFRALLSVLRHGSRAGVEQRKMVKAGIWNVLHLPATLWRRHGVQKLGATYTSLLSEDALEDISVIVPCHNYANYVRETLTSVVQQTLQPSEVIVINDGSTDNSWEIIQDFVAHLSKTYPHIIFTALTQKNKGVIATKNRGLELARSQWIVFLDADDTLDVHYLEKCMAIQRAHDVDVVYTDMQMFGAIDFVQKVLPYNKYRLRSVNFIHNSSLFNANLLRRAEGYSPEMSMGFEDWELNLKLSKLTDKFYYLPEPLLNYRRHEGASRDNNAQQKLYMVVKLLEERHPELYNLPYYYWLETNRFLHGLRRVVAYPFLLAKHTYYHTIMGLDRRAKHSRSAHKIVSGLRAVKGKGKK